MYSQAVTFPVDELLRLLDQVRAEARRSNLSEVAFMIELAMTAACDAAGMQTTAASAGGHHLN